MTEILEWLFDGVTLADIVIGFFHVMGAWGFFKAVFNSGWIRELEDRLNRLERKRVWK